MMMLDHALAYAARGWPVFPCDPRQDPPGTRPSRKRSKSPLVAGPDRDEAGEKIPRTGGLYRATTDEAQIRDWWGHRPDALIGVPTGRALGLFVIDLDPRDGASLADVEARLTAEIGTLPPAPRSITQSGGAHLWFRVPERGEIPRNGAKRIDGVDWRGEGGYVIVPPSVMADGAAYRWVIEPEETPFPEAPAALLDLIFKRGRFADAPKRQAPGVAPQRVDDERVRRYALSALDAELSELASAAPGQRGWTLNKIGYSLGQIVGAGVLDEGTVAAGMESAATRNGLVGTDGLKSVRANIERSIRDGAREPRDISDVGRLRGGTRPPMPGDDDRPAAPEGGRPASSRGAKGDGGASGGGSGGEDGGDEIWRQNAGEPQNDTGNGRRLIRLFGPDMLNVREVGEHYWTGTHWEATGGGEAFIRNAQRTAEMISVEAAFLELSPRAAEAVEAGETFIGKPAKDLTDEQKALAKRAAAILEALEKRQSQRRAFAISSGNSSRISGMIAQAMPHLTVAPDDLDADPLVINVMNGTLRLFKGPDPEDPDPDGGRLAWQVRLDEHAREDWLSKLMRVSYDPAADCPKWRDFMERFQPRPEIARFLQQWHGYALTGLMGEQIFVYNYGLGANGKSTFMEALARLMGAYAQVLPAESLTGDSQRRGDQATPEFARLPGARLVRCAELPRGQGFRESTIKMLTGGEPMLVRHLNHRFFELHPTFKAIGSGNDRPHVGGVDEGIWRRIKLVPWTETIPVAERRPMAKVLAEFQAEAAGILNWLLDGLVDYLENGLVVPPEIQAATESYRADMDPVGEFTLSCVAPAPGEHVTGRDMYNAYVAWCHANSVKPFAERGFAGIMMQKGFKKENGRIRKYLDVELKDVPADPEERDKSWTKDVPGW